MTRNEETYEQLAQLLMRQGMTPNAARQYASRAFERNEIHSWNDGQCSTVIEGRVDSSAAALANYATRVVASAPPADVPGRGPTDQEISSLIDAKLGHMGTEYSF
jgi:hypothetical protein